MNLIRTAVVCALASVAAVSFAGDRLDAIQKSGVIRVGTPADYRPFSMDEAGKIQGHDAELIEAMAAAAGWKVEYVKTPWKEIEAGVKGNRFDIAVGGITQTLARTTWGQFLPGYAPFGKVALVRKSELAKYKSVDDLNQPSVRVIKNPGGTNEQFVLKNLTKAQVSTHEKNYEIPGLIAEGKGDVMITETAEAKLYAKKDSRLAAAFIDHPLTPVNEMGFLMPTDDADFTRTMGYLWHLMEIRGELSRIEAKWFE
ncbi:transporter substrate-binding domain-containing protein [Sutterella sp.]|uniref:transporter substrate-binding domain-containing protein n=1 Tax=Sutterella sp. TaxID=1981025 RepID=UPI0026E101EC|nr:transporter substrate-binding domain-containing protein [Sutterella sp.]MDO5531476.1 transporter substrate-binding domain-containing protein [Sutterella sp.]